MKQLYFYLIADRRVSAVLLAATVVVLYGNSLDNSFQYDDSHSIVENPHIRDLTLLGEYFYHPEYFSRDGDKAMYRPLLLVSLALNYAWSGYDTYSYHLVNTALHLACTLLVWALILQLGRPPCMALLAALLFAVHPLGSEPVNYISSRSELMAALSLLSALWLYAQYVDRPRWAIYGFMLICYAGGLFSKSIVVVLPLWLLAWDAHRRALGLSAWRRHALVWLITAVYVLGMRGMLSRAVVAEPVRTWSAQTGTQLKALVYYAKQVFTPTHLSVDHAFVESPLSATLPWLCLLLLLSIALVVYRLKGEWLGGALGISVLLPTLIVPLNVLVNDHRLYLLVAGLAIALSGLKRLESASGLRWWAPLLIAVWCLLSWQRNEVWQDESTLWRDAATKDPNSVRAHVFLGNAARRNGKPQEALTYYKQALNNDSTNVVARAGLASAHSDLGEFSMSIKEFERALAEAPQMRDFHYSLGRVLQQDSRRTEARVHYLAVSPDSPHWSIARNNIGTLYELDGHIDSAIVYYREAFELGAADGRNNLRRLTQKLVEQAEAHLQQGGPVMAEEVARMALFADPSHRYARFFLVWSLFQQGRYGESIKENKALVRLYPDFDDGRLQLANALESSGRAAEAVEVYEELIRRTKNGEMRALARRRLQSLLERNG